jgi:hypothetical protein
MLSNFATAAIRKAVQAEVVHCNVDLRKQSPFQLFELHEADLAFEHGFLYSLPGTLADLCYPTQAAATFLRLRVDVIANQHQHVITSP